MSELSHYGKIVNSENPVTGVINSNEVSWDFMDNDYTCLVCDGWIQEHNIASDNDDYQFSENCPNCKDWGMYCLDFMSCDSSHTKLHGDWILDTKTGLYEPDKTGEYAMIENESTCQIVFSKTIKKGNPCSPCYPGQVEFSNDGDFKAYTLPSELLYQDED
jgi:hypothetical protein